MKKFLLFAAAAMVVTLLSAPVAYAAPGLASATEIGPVDVPTGDTRTEIQEPEVPLAEEPVDIDEPEVPLAEEPVDIEDPEVPLSEEPVDIEDPEVPLVAAPQTGVTSLSGMETMTLAAMAFAVSGAVLLAKARKQTGSVR